MDGRAKAYLGAAGELRAASELSLRGYVVHLPAVDEGGDLWVVDETTGASYRVQVKSCVTYNSHKWPGNRAYEFGVRASLLASNVLFVIYLVVEERWGAFLVHAVELNAALSPARKNKQGNWPTKRVIWMKLDLAAMTLITPGGKGIQLNKHLECWDQYLPRVRETSAI